MRALALAIVVVAASGAAFAQGVAPGGGIGNSTGIGSGLGGGGGTGPSYPNGTTQPSLPAPPPPGGSIPSIAHPPTPLSTGSGRSSAYPQPRTPNDATTPSPSATVPLALPDKAGGDLGFLKGCWRSEAFESAQHKGTTTWCFDDKGVGRFLYTRIDQANYFCNAQAEARYAGDALHLHSQKTNCSDPVPVDMDCRASGEAALCRSGDASSITLYRVR
jgi:hypothetical protein